jgi:hypothetical protein
MTFPAAPHVAARPDEIRQLSSIRKCADIQSVVSSRLLFGVGQRVTLAQIDRELNAWRFCGATRMNVYTRPDRIGPTSWM